MGSSGWVANILKWSITQNLRIIRILILIDKLLYRVSLPKIIVAKSNLLNQVHKNN